MSAALRHLSHVIKVVLLSFMLSAARFGAAAEEPSMPPLKAIEKFGSISIADGSSFFTFSKDGSFQSGPLGISGRAFEGRWTASGDYTFSVIAKVGWVNGASSGQDFRRIVFAIYHVRKRPPELAPAKRSHIDLFDGY